MKYQLELDVDLPRERLLELFLDPNNLAKWQPDFVSFEPIGEKNPRELGGKSRQVHRMGKREVELIETITVSNYPDEFAATYEGNGVWNLIENRFVVIDDYRTKWLLDCEFKCSGFVGLMTYIMPGAFKKQTSTFMNRFKDFAENAQP